MIRAPVEHGAHSFASDHVLRCTSSQVHPVDVWLLLLLRLPPARRSLCERTFGVGPRPVTGAINGATDRRAISGCLRSAYDQSGHNRRQHSLGDTVEVVETGRGTEGTKDPTDMRITGIQARTASAARSSIEWARLRPKLVALMVASAAVVVAAGVIVAVCMSGNSAAQDGPDVNCAGASVGKPETSRVKWTPATAAGAAAGVAGLWAYNRYLKRKPEPERAVVDKPSKQAATSHWRNLKSHMTKVNAVTAAKKGVSILGFDPVDMLFMGMAGLYALEEFQPGS